MKKKVIYIFIIAIFLTMILGAQIYADSSSIISAYKSGKDTSNDGELILAGGKILWIVQFVGYGISIISLTIIGVKYMFSSVQDKADLKKKLIPFVTGAIIVFGCSAFMGIIARFAEGAIL